ncbi:unnamed protein product [Brachionus calyciflorus]|uniref:Uncharacterized protein n=1 Tax=Brachionus calyciflorus TaxID=104777 RepID=A0A813Y2H9_9BILA|nr:unnamed protein product [Brachionus calyciflorus]
MANMKLKLFMSSILVLTSSLTILNFVSSRLCHSSVLALTGIINLSQFNFFLVKFVLLKKKKGNNASRLGILIDLINSIFVCAICFSTLIKSIESIFSHQSVHGIDQENDQLHHEHKPLSREILMLSTGLITFTGQFIIFIIFLVLNLSQNNENIPDESFLSESILRKSDKIKSFEPFNDIKVKKENCVLIIREY